MSRNPKSRPQPSTELAASSAPAAVADRTIALVGMMGCGKSSVGRRLAQALGRNFVDSDSEIEAAAGMAVGDIFARLGEAEFRSGEARVIARLLAGPPMVLATGGGAFVQPATRALLRARALTIWLDVPLPVLAERVGRRPTRPLLAGRDPLAVLTELDAVRRPAYVEADIRVALSGGTHETAVRRISEAIAAWSKQ